MSQSSQRCYSHRKTGQPFIVHFQEDKTNMHNVNVATLILGTPNQEEPLPEVKLRLASERLSARELLAKTVAEQWHALKADQHDNARIEACIKRHYLDAEAIAEQADSGKIALPAKDSNKTAQIENIEQHIDRVLNAFARGCFKMFVDGEEVAGLDDHCLLVDGTQVRFIRLIPLVGG